MNLVQYNIRPSESYIVWGQSSEPRPLRRTALKLTMARVPCLWGRDRTPNKRHGTHGYPQIVETTRPQVRCFLSKQLKGFYLIGQISNTFVLVLVLASPARPHFLLLGVAGHIAYLGTHSPSGHYRVLRQAVPLCAP